MHTTFKKVLARRGSTRTGSVRVLEEDENQPGDQQRRDLLRSLAICGASVPAYLAAGEIGAFADTAAAQRRLAIDPKPLTVQSEIRIVRDFADPYFELMRLLRDATEIEHGLM